MNEQGDHTCLDVTQEAGAALEDSRLLPLVEDAMPLAGDGDAAPAGATSSGERSR